MPVRTRPIIALCVAVLLGGGAPQGDDRAERNAVVFDRVWGEVDRLYWDRDRLGDAWERARDVYRPRALAAPDAAGLYATLSAMLATVDDSHVYALPPAQVAFDHAGDAGTKRAEYGFASWPVDGASRILAVRPGSPAAVAGVRPGWMLGAIDGHAIADDWHPQAGERTRFRFVDAHGAPRTIDLTARLLPALPARRATRLPGDVLLITFDAFDPGLADWIANRIAEVPPAALILDLRENEGGEAREVARVAGLLFDRRRTLLKRVARGKTLDVPVLGAGHHGYAGPLAVLVGPRSMSGAEVLAALVQDADRGATIGEPTAGAVTGAERERLPDGGEVWIAVFDIRSANDVRLEGHGVAPTTIVRQSLAQLRAGIDPVLTTALAILRPTPPSSQPSPPPIVQLPVRASRFTMPVHSIPPRSEGIA